MNEQLYQLALEFLPGIGDVGAKTLISYCGSAESVFKSSPSQLKKIPGIGSKTIESLGNKEALSCAEKVLKDCEKHQVDILHYTDSSYPSRLKQAVDAPNIIYSKGAITDHSRIIAIVGTRNATEYGSETTERIVEDSKTLNAVIVSGLAYGIDIAAHKSALKNNIPTIAVLAGGLDKVYPNIHKKYADEMLELGGWISENPPGTKPDAHFFPARNRIIAGMSDATIVVEAAKKGGALITANIADSYDRPVFAVPGDLNHKFSEGCNFLIRNQKALIFTSVEDLKYHLNWNEESEAIKQQKEKDYSNLEEPDRKIVDILKNHPNGLPIDEISWRSQISLNQLAGNLLNLEFQGLLKSLPGKKYKLI
jgi:DNA processing protein